MDTITGGRSEKAAAPYRAARGDPSPEINRRVNIFPASNGASYKWRPRRRFINNLHFKDSPIGRSGCRGAGTIGRDNDAWLGDDIPAGHGRRAVMQPRGAPTEMFWRGDSRRVHGGVAGRVHTARQCGQMAPDIAGSTELLCRGKRERNIRPY